MTRARQELIAHRIHGARGSRVTLLHGGPGAPGHMAGIASELAGEFRVVEPFERRSDDAELSVDRHVADLSALLDSLTGNEPTAIVGFSSGAITALTFAARHARQVTAIALVGSATFTAAARAEFRQRLELRLSASLREELRQADSIPDLDARLAARSRLIIPAYFVDPLGYPSDVWVDGRGHEQTWRDMLRLQQNGRQPQEFRTIGVPVLMLHGAEDPHPGRLISESLRNVLPQLQYVELARCGHYPWLEKPARVEFFTVLIDFLRAASDDAECV